MDSIVAVVRGTDKLASFDKLLELTDFKRTLLGAHERSGVAKADFRIVIKPNIMVFVNQKDWDCIVTDREMVELLVDAIRGLGFTHLAICEAQTDVSMMLKNQEVAFVADKVGYRPEGRYRIADLTLESKPYAYEYLGADGKPRIFRDFVGETWRDAHFRISFAKAKTHEHDYLTLSIKNVYGCFPSPTKIRSYHMRDEVFDVTARSLRNFPVHFAFVDAWMCSDGFQGYKVAHRRPLLMLFGGPSPVAVDTEICKRAGIDPRKCKMIVRTAEQIHGGVLPTYTVKGDTETRFADVVAWENIKDETVASIDRREEVYINWGLVNSKAAELIDQKMFPPRNLIYRIGLWSMKWVYRALVATGLWQRLFPH